MRIEEFWRRSFWRCIFRLPLNLFIGFFPTSPPLDIRLITTYYTQAKLLCNSKPPRLSPVRYQKTIRRYLGRASFWNTPLASAVGISTVSRYCKSWQHQEYLMVTRYNPCLDCCRRHIRPKQTTMIEVAMALGASSTSSSRQRDPSPDIGPVVPLITPSSSATASLRQNIADAEARAKKFEPVHKGAVKNYMELTENRT